MTWINNMPVTAVEHYSLDDIIAFSRHDRTALKRTIGDVNRSLRHWFPRLHRQFYSSNGEGVLRTLAFSPGLVGLFEKSARDSEYRGHYINLGGKQYFGTPTQIEGEPWERVAVMTSEQILQVLPPQHNLFITPTGKIQRAHDQRDLLLVYPCDGHLISPYRD